MELWSQVYDPLGNTFLSTLVCAIPVIVLLGGLGIFHIKAHIAAVAGLISSLAIAVFIVGMPTEMAGRAALFGGLFGLIGIVWIIVNLIFMYRLTLKAGLFKILQDSIGGISNDRRLQLVLIAFCFGAFFEGAAGGGTPVAVTGAILIGLGFSPLAASGLSLIANTAPVAYGGLGTPIIVLNSVTQNTDEYLLTLSAMVGRQLPFFSVIVPFWLVITFCGLRNTLAIWPAILVAGVSFAIPQFLISNLPRSMARGHAVGHDLDGHAGLVPHQVEAEAGDDGRRRPRRQPGVLRRGAAQHRRPRSQQGDGDQGLDALDHPDRASSRCGASRG